MNIGDMEKYCPKPHPVYFNAFSMWQQLSGSVQYLIKYRYRLLFKNTILLYNRGMVTGEGGKVLIILEIIIIFTINIE